MEESYSDWKFVTRGICNILTTHVNIRELISKLADGTTLVDSKESCPKLQDVNEMEKLGKALANEI